MTDHLRDGFAEGVAAGWKAAAAFVQAMSDAANRGSDRGPSLSWGYAAEKLTSAARKECAKVCGTTPVAKVKPSTTAPRIAKRRQAPAGAVQADMFGGAA